MFSTKILKQWEKAEKRRAKDMPTDDDALRVMFTAWERLKELGWRPIMYCPKDGTMFDSIEAGSTGIHTCNYKGEWPNGHWWAYDEDTWPAHPILFKPKEPTP